MFTVDGQSVYSRQTHVSTNTSRSHRSHRSKSSRSTRPGHNSHKQDVAVSTEDKPKSHEDREKIQVLFINY